MMTLRRSRRRAVPAHLKGFLLERVSSREEPAAAARPDTSSCVSDTSLEDKHLRNAAVLPVLRPAASVSTVGECRQEEPLSIHGRSVQEYQHIYRCVMDSTMKKRRRSRYSLQQGLEIKQRLWEKLDRPALLETEMPDGRVVITEIRSGSSLAPHIKVDISKEPLPDLQAYSKAWRSSSGCGRSWTGLHCWRQRCLTDVWSSQRSGLGPASLPISR
nr:uncharacterized protein LOC110438941 [Danio rerio]|eukprot:XP_021328220.1 uncharacterized protein LOC110438941 [Danio rerio]